MPISPRFIIHCLIVLITVTLSVPCHAEKMQTKRIVLNLKAGDYTRANQPTSLLIDKPDFKVGGVWVLFSSKQIDAGQLLKPSILGTDKQKIEDKMELHFLIPYLAKGKEHKVVVVLTEEKDTGHGYGWGIKEADKSTELRCVGCHKGKKEPRYVRYHYKKIGNKNTIASHQILGTGNQPLANSPRGSFLGHLGFLYSGDKSLTGEHSKFVAEDGGRLMGRQTVEINWTDDQKKVFGKEIRQMSIYPIKGKIFQSLTDFAIQVTPTSKANNIGLKRLENKNINGEISYLTSKTETGKWAKAKGIAELPVDAIAFKTEDRGHTLLYFTSPDNPVINPVQDSKQFSAKSKPGEPLLFKYRLWIQQGQISDTEAEGFIKRLTTPVTIELAKPKTSK